jgi:hypothetical protein
MEASMPTARGHKSRIGIRLTNTMLISSRVIIVLKLIFRRTSFEKTAILHFFLCLLLFLRSIPNQVPKIEDPYIYAPIPEYLKLGESDISTNKEYPYRTKT